MSCFIGHVTEDGAGQIPIDSLKGTPEGTPGISELKVVTGAKNEPAADLQLSQVDGCHPSPHIWHCQMCNKIL